ncbi:MAG: hypothetical protein ACE5FL_10905, partial [Myxococcota bacterium]
MATRSLSRAKGALPVLQAADAGFEKKFATLLNRRDSTLGDVEKSVRKIVECLGGRIDLVSS